MVRWFTFLFSIIATVIMPVEAYSQNTRSLLILGDSLSSADGMALDQSWVYLLQERLKAKGYTYQVDNASVSGNTSLDALTRLQRMDSSPEVAIVAIGGNDGLRGLPVTELRHNLSAIISHLTDMGARVLLLRMHAPPNYGPAYTESFDKAYEIAASMGVELVPFILTDVIDKPDLMQADGLHPTATAQPVILDAIWPYLEPLLETR